MTWVRPKTSCASSISVDSPRRMGNSSYALPMALRNRQLQRLRRHRVPAWWRDAKLGIFVHWTIASVPAFAPVDIDIGELVQSGRRDALAFSPYAEWYENSLKFPDSPAARHHREVFGNRPYTDFATEWEAALDQW